MDKILKNFLRVEDVIEERPTLDIFDKDQIQEAINMSLDLLDSECNGLILDVIQYSLSREVKDEESPFYRTDKELGYLKRALISQTQYQINLNNDSTIGTSSISTGGIAMSDTRPQNYDRIAPGVRENLSKARVYKINEAFRSSGVDKRKECLDKMFIKREESGEFIKYFQPNMKPGSVLVVNDSNLIRGVNPSEVEYKTINADKIKDRNNEYKNIWDIDNLAFYGKNGTDAMRRQEVLNAIWGSMFWHKDTTYPNEAIVRYYDSDNNEVLTFKSNQDNNIGHNPLKDNKDGFWWKQVGSAENIDFDEIAKRIVEGKELANKLSLVNDEIQNQLEALWEQIKDHPHLMKKFEEMYDQLHSEINAIEPKIDTKLSGYAKKDANNVFVNQNIFQSHSEAIIVRGNAKRYITIANQNNSPILRIGREANSGDGHIYAAQNSLIIGSKQNMDLKPEGIYQLRIYNTINMLGNKIENLKNPENNKDATTKEYVDNAIRNNQGSNVDLTNVPKLNEDNTYEGGTKQTFWNVDAQNINAGRGIYSNNFEYESNPGTLSDLQLTHKKYVDDKFLPKRMYEETNGGIIKYINDVSEVRLTKKDISSSIETCFIYSFQQGNMLNIDVGTLGIGSYVATIEFTKIEDKTTSKRKHPFNFIFTHQFTLQTALSQIIVPINEPYTFLLAGDLMPGGAGNLSTIVYFKCIIHRMV